MPEIANCSKCGKDLDTDGYPKWCKACRAKYKREYDATREDMLAATSFHAGVNAFRQQTATMMARCPGSMFEGQAVARWILEFPAPAYTVPRETAAEIVKAS